MVISERNNDFRLTLYTNNICNSGSQTNYGCRPGTGPNHGILGEFRSVEMNLGLMLSPEKLISFLISGWPCKLREYMIDFVERLAISHS